LHKTIDWAKLQSSPIGARITAMSQGKAVIDELRYIFENVNRWLQYAEAKNGVLVALAGAALFPLNEIASKAHSINAIYLKVLTGSLGLALLCSLVSFVPQTRLKWSDRKKKLLPSDNIFFFGDIQKYEPDEYLEKVYDSNNIGGSKIFSTAEKNLASQIIVNSFISSRKYMLFKFAVWLVIFGVLTPVIGMILLFIVELNT
jgi:hypothetical protein